MGTPHLFLPIEGAGHVPADELAACCADEVFGFVADAVLGEEDAEEEEGEGGRGNDESDHGNGEGETSGGGGGDALFDDGGRSGSVCAAAAANDSAAWPFSVDARAWYSCASSAGATNDLGNAPRMCAGDPSSVRIEVTRGEAECLVAHARECKIDMRQFESLDYDFALDGCNGM